MYAKYCVHCQSLNLEPRCGGLRIRNKKWEIITHPSNVWESCSRASEQGPLLKLKPQRHFSSLYPVTQAAFHFQPFSVLNWILGWKSDSFEGVGKDNPTIWWWWLTGFIKEPSHSCHPPRRVWHGFHPPFLCFLPLRELCGRKHRWRAKSALPPPSPSSSSFSPSSVFGSNPTGTAFQCNTSP